MTMINYPTEIIRFNEADIDVYEVSGQKWLRLGQISDSLRVVERTVKRTFKAHQKEFGPDETGIIHAPTPGGPQMIRVFSPRGAARIAMLSKSPYAAQFRDKVLDVLEGIAIPDHVRVAAATDVPSNVLHSLQMMFLGRRGNTDLIRYLELGLGSAEIGRLLGVTPNSIGVRRRMAEYLGLVEVPDDIEKYRTSASFQRLVEARDRGKRAYYDRLPAPAETPEEANRRRDAETARIERANARRENGNG